MMKHIALLAGVLTPVFLSACATTTYVRPPVYVESAPAPVYVEREAPREVVVVHRAPIVREYRPVYVEHERPSVVVVRPRDRVIETCPVDRPPSYRERDVDVVHVRDHDHVEHEHHDNGNHYGWQNGRGNKGDKGKGDKGDKGRGRGNGDGHGHGHVDHV